MGLKEAMRSGRGIALFWTGFFLSVLGDAVTRTTLVWYVFDLSNSTVTLGWFSFSFAAPVIVGGMIAGWLLDRFDRRAVMIIDSLTKALLVASLPVLAALGAMPLWYVFAAAGVLGFLMVVPLAGVPSLLPVLVDADDLNAANALETIGYSAGGALGPPLAGLMIAHIGPLAALYVDAASYVTFACGVWLCRPNREPGSAKAGATTGLIAAVRIIALNPALASTTLMYLIFNVGLGALLVVLPVLADTVLAGGPELYGLLLGSIAFGELASAAAISGIRLAVPEGLAICLTFSASGVAVALVAFNAHIAGAVIGLALYGAFSAPLTVWGQTLRMRIIPADLRGRCFAIMRTLMQSGQPLGGVSAGFAALALGSQAIVAAIALVTTFTGAAGLTIADLRRAH